MRKILPAMGVAMSFLLLPLAAQADGSYLKIGAGHSRYSVAGDSESRTGWLLAYGAALDKTWGVEGGYVNFGRLGGLEIDEDTVSFQARALYLAGTGSIPLGQSVSLYGKLGAAAKRFSGGGESETKFSPLVGVGATLNLGPQWGLALEYASYGKTEGLRLSQTSLSVLYAF